MRKKFNLSNDKFTYLLAKDFPILALECEFEGSNNKQRIKHWMGPSYVGGIINKEQCLSKLPRECIENKKLMKHVQHH